MPAPASLAKRKACWFSLLALAVYVAEDVERIQPWQSRVLVIAIIIQPIMMTKVWIDENLVIFICRQSLIFLVVSK